MDYSVPVELTEQSVRKVSFQVLADVVGNNTYSLDITDDLISIDNIVTDLELKKTGSIIGRPSVNTACITLSNINGRYSPNNPKNVESEHAGWQFRTNTKIKISAGFIDANNIPQQRVLFVGVISNFKGKYSGKEKTMTLSLKDMAKFAKKKKNPNHNFTNGLWYEAVLFDATISEAVNCLMDYCYGTSYPRTINATVERLPVIEFPIDQFVWNTIQKLAEASNAMAFFEGDSFRFYTPLSPEYSFPDTSVYTFTGSNIFDFMENIDEENIINKCEITSNAKTLQPRQIVVGTPTVNIITANEQYNYADGKSALGLDGKTITLKSQEPDLSWVDTINIPLVDVTTYSDLYSPTEEAIANMNNTSVIKVFDNNTGLQLTIQDIVLGDSINPGQIVLKDALNLSIYDINVVYQYYTNKIVYGKYKWYEFQLDKLARNVEYPTIEAYNKSGNQVIYSYTSSINTLYLSDFTILDGNKRIKYKLTNNVPVSGTDDMITISRSEIYGNTLECVATMNFKSVDASISDFENAYEVSNDYFVNPDWGKRVTDYLLFKYKQNLSFIDVNTKGIPQISLFDRITLIEKTSTNNTSLDFIVNGIKHTIKNDGWKTNLSLESMSPPFVYDESRINFSYYKLGQNFLSLNSFTPPSDPLRYVVYQNEKTLQHVWKIPQDVLGGVEIRKLNPDTLDWEFGEIVDTHILNSKYLDSNVVIGTSTYGIKSINSNGLYSNNMLTSSVAVSFIPSSNMIEAFDEFQALDGTFTDCYLIDNIIKLEVDEYWDDTTNDLWSDSETQLWGEPTKPFGIYETQIKDLGRVINADTRVSTWLYTDGYEIWWKYSDIDATLSSVDWKPFNTGKYSYRYYQWQLKLKSAGGHYQELTGFKVSIDVPSITLEYPNSTTPTVAITDATNGKRIDFPVNFLDPPTITGSVVGTAGYIIPESHETYCIIKATANGTDLITGNVHLQIKGY